MNNGAENRLRRKPAQSTMPRMPGREKQREQDERSSGEIRIKNEKGSAGDGHCQERRNHCDPCPSALRLWEKIIAPIPTRQQCQENRREIPEIPPNRRGCEISARM